MKLTTQISRRRFVGTAAAGAAGVLLASCKEPPAPKLNTIESATLKTRHKAPTETVAAGLHKLGLDPIRDGFLYVPPSYKPAVPAPLLILLHGAGGDSRVFEAIAPTLADPEGMVIMAPDSSSRTWDRILGAYGPDVQFIDAALALVFRKCNINPQRIALGGFSDGATYALSLGITNGDLFPYLVAFSPGYAVPAGERGKPGIYVSHGIHDTVLPINVCSRVIVPALREEGYTVMYREFDGGHAVPLAIAQEATDWFLAPAT